MFGSARVMGRGIPNGYVISYGTSVTVACLGQSLLTQEARHVNRGPQRDSAHTVREYIAAMTVYHAVNCWKSLVYFAMDMSLKIARLCILFHRDAVFDIVLH